MGLQQTQTLKIPPTYSEFVHNSSSEKLLGEVASLENLLYADDFEERHLIAAKLHFVKSILSAQRATQNIVQKLLEK